MSRAIGGPHEVHLSVKEHEEGGVDASRPNQHLLGARPVYKGEGLDTDLNLARTLSLFLNILRGHISCRVDQQSRDAVGGHGVLRQASAVPLQHWCGG